MAAKNLYGSEYFQSIYANLAKEKKWVLTSFYDLLAQRGPDIKTLLDLGCGQGEFLQICEAHDIQCFGVDISDYALDKARQSCKAQLFKLDLNQQNLPLADNFFDAVTCFDLVEHLESPDLVFSEAYRVLRSKGLFFMTTPKGGLWSRGVVGRVLQDDITHINVREPEYWRKTIVNAGFKDLEMKGCFWFGFPPVLQVRCWLRKRNISVCIRPFFTPFFSLASTLFIFAKK